MAEIEKLDGKSLDVVEQNIEQLKELFPNVFSEGKIQFNRLEELLGHYVVDDEDHYNFTWHGKRKAGRLAQTPSTGTLRPSKEESEGWDTTENLFIEGDNLEVLKLLQKSYHRQVKMIYIDPPYNTGNDFVYEDDFKDGVKNYLEMTGQLDGDGKKVGTNSSAAGRYHTNWLNMMYPRLKLARNLLRDDGVIYISIDENEQANLKKLCDEIFGEENFVAGIAWEKVHTRKNSSKYFSTSHEYVFCVAKNKSLFKRNLLPREDTSAYKNPDNHPKGPWKPDPITAHNEYSADYTITKPNGLVLHRPQGRYWAFSEESIKTKIANNEIIWGEGDSYPMIKRFLSETQDGLVPITLFSRKFAGDTSASKKEIDGLMGIQNLFEYVKPTKLIEKLALIGGNSDSLIIDFFAGSGTTAHALMQMNVEDSGVRRCISVQLPEKTSEKSEAHRAGYLNIADISKERIRRAAKKIKDENPDYKGDLGFKVFKLDSSNIKRWDADFDSLEQDLVDAADYLVEGRRDEDVLYELCLKLGLDLSVKIDEKSVAGEKLFVLGRGYLVVCLSDNVTMDLVNGIGDLKNELEPEDGMRVVFKDDGFKDDVVKTNALQTLKRFGIDDIKSL